MKIGDLEIEIKRSKRRKTITVNIERDGSVNAVAPIDCDDETIRKELEAREYLICKHVAHRKAVNKAYINRNFVNGQAFLFMGKSYNLLISETARKSLEIVDDKFVLNERCLPKAKETFIKFYKKQGLPYLQERIAHFSELVGRAPTSIRLIELGGHWASCTPQHTINFHWKTKKTMKKLTILLTLCVLTLLAFANDGVYYAAGNQLIPITETDIQVKKEILTLNRTQSGRLLPERKIQQLDQKTVYGLVGGN